jgi:hypothetical protein
MGADLVGGIDPANFDRDVEKHLDVVFGIAQKRGVDVDIHLHDAGTLDSAPDLTGFASRDWLRGFISDPNHERFYGKGNDRMPAFAAHPDDPAKNQLTQRELDLLIEWLRGEWYESAK